MGRLPRGRWRRHVAPASVAPAPLAPALDVYAAPLPDAGALAALSDNAVIAWVSAVEPPLRLVLHVSPEASPRDVARLETAIRAWGFAPPELRPAQEPVLLPEVAFHHAQDRDAALLLARIARNILSEAVLSSPEPGAEAAASPHGTLDPMVISR